MPNTAEEQPHEATIESSAETKPEAQAEQPELRANEAVEQIRHAAQEALTDSAKFGMYAEAVQRVGSELPPEIAQQCDEVLRQAEPAAENLALLLSSIESSNGKAETSQEVNVSSEVATAIRPAESGSEGPTLIAPEETPLTAAEINPSTSPEAPAKETGEQREFREKREAIEKQLNQLTLNEAQELGTIRENGRGFSELRGSANSIDRRYYNPEDINKAAERISSEVTTNQIYDAKTRAGNLAMGSLGGDYLIRTASNFSQTSTSSYERRKAANERLKEIHEITDENKKKQELAKWKKEQAGSGKLDTASDIGVAVWDTATSVPELAIKGSANIVEVVAKGAIKIPWRILKGFANKAWHGDKGSFQTIASRMDKLEKVEASVNKLKEISVKRKELEAQLKSMGTEYKPRKQLLEEAQQETKNRLIKEQKYDNFKQQVDKMIADISEQIASTDDETIKKQLMDRADAIAGTFSARDKRTGEYINMPNERNVSGSEYSLAISGETLKFSLDAEQAKEHVSNAELMSKNEAAIYKAVREFLKKDEGTKEAALQNHFSIEFNGVGDIVVSFTEPDKARINVKIPESYSVAILAAIKEGKVGKDSFLPDDLMQTLLKEYKSDKKADPKPDQAPDDATADTVASTDDEAEPGKKTNTEADPTADPKKPEITEDENAEVKAASSRILAELRAQDQLKEIDKNAVIRVDGEGKLIVGILSEDGKRMSKVIAEISSEEQIDLLKVRADIIILAKPENRIALVSAEQDSSELPTVVVAEEAPTEIMPELPTVVVAEEAPTTVLPVNEMGTQKSTMETISSPEEPYDLGDEPTAPMEEELGVAGTGFEDDAATELMAETQTSAEAPTEKMPTENVVDIANRIAQEQKPQGPQISLDETQPIDEDEIPTEIAA
ncbi:MAG: hypothetical protein Q8P90_00960 [bacterium]|nr:hypothetical protein [bacterium]